MVMIGKPVLGLLSDRRRFVAVGRGTPVGIELVIDLVAELTVFKQRHQAAVIGHKAS